MLKKSWKNLRGMPRNIRFLSNSLFCYSSWFFLFFFINREDYVDFRENLEYFEFIRNVSVFWWTFLNCDGGPNSLINYSFFITSVDRGICNCIID